LDIFERTTLVVYTVGNAENPAYTCQARPQEGEVFGEFPPRRQFDLHTSKVVIVPSPTPACNSVFSQTCLESAAKREYPAEALRTLVTSITDSGLRGYAQLIAEYLVDVCSENPKRGTGERTALFGLQRPPLNANTMLRVSDNDQGLVYFLCYLLTNAPKPQISCASDELNRKFSQFTTCVTQNEEEYKAFVEQDNDLWCVVDCSVEEYFLPGYFVGKFLPMGHVKSTLSNDEEFLALFKESKKWLKIEN